VGIPASIDNDIGLTGLAIGVDTAMNTIVEACDKISDTAAAFDRTFLVEVMGRSCGYLAMTAAVAAGADGVIFPEAQKTPSDLVEAVVKTVVQARRRAGRPRRAIIIKAEGAPIAVDVLKREVDRRLGEVIGPHEPVETRVTVLGHVVRGGRPSAFDRLLASRLAHVAVAALLQGQTRKMAAWMPAVALDPAVAEQSRADPYCWLVELDAVLAETRRLLDGSSPLTAWRTRIFGEIEEVLPA
jgi:6-phosphofructokinase 1